MRIYFSSVGESTYLNSLARPAGCQPPTLRSEDDSDYDGASALSHRQPQRLLRLSAERISNLEKSG